MKKTIILLSILLITSIGYSQQYLMNNVLTTGTYSLSVSGRSAIIQLTTSTTYNGSTGTDSLKYSNDAGTHWSIVYQSDNTTPMAYTLSTGANSKTWNLITANAGWYAIFHTKGNATLGGVTAVLIAK